MLDVAIVGCGVIGQRRAKALGELKELHDRGADPLAVMQDLLEIVHFLTRVKVAPSSQGFFDGGSSEAKRAGEMAAKLSVPSLTRAWQMLLKGLLEVRDAVRPAQAAEQSRRMGSGDAGAIALLESYATGSFDGPGSPGESYRARSELRPGALGAGLQPYARR